jgi:hypothetical protein
VSRCHPDGNVKLFVGVKVAVKVIYKTSLIYIIA